MRFEASQVIERPVAVVFRFFADDHVRNHPRWDPSLELEQVTDAPIGVGTTIRRRNRRYSTPVEETMEVVEFERERAMGTRIYGGPMEMSGRATFEAVAPDRTNLTISADIPSFDKAVMDASQMTDALGQSIRQIKDFIETET